MKLEDIKAGMVLRHKGYMAVPTNFELSFGDSDDDPDIVPAFGQPFFNNGINPDMQAHPSSIVHVSSINMAYKAVMIKESPGWQFHADEFNLAETEKPKDGSYFD